jgi:hypothetical protein
MVSNSHALRFDNPQARLNPLRRERTNRSVKALQARANGLIDWTQHNNAHRTSRVVAAGVGKIGIECDEDAPLPLTRGLKRAIVRPHKLLRVYVIDIPTAFGEPGPRGARQILVELETHRLGRNRHHAFVGEGGSIGNRRGNVRGLK